MIVTGRRRLCAPGCPNNKLTCPKHGRAGKQRAFNQWRGSASEMGYDRTWEKFVRWYRNEQFRLDVDRAGLCGSRLPEAPPTDDSRCAKDGLVVLGNIADHIVPVTGPDDPRFLDPSNIQLLCGSGNGQNCHDRKRVRESTRGMR